LNNIYKILEKKIGVDFLNYRSKWKSTEKNICILKYPLHLNFELTFGCNLKCDMCLHSIPFRTWNYKSNPKKKIEFEHYKKIIDEGVRYGLSSVEFNGINEPLLNKDIHKYIQYAKQKGILMTSLHTNALLLNKDMSEKIINSGLTLIIFSIDAFSKETYKKIRKNNGYEKVIKNIDILLKMKQEKRSDYPLTKVSFAENKINYTELNDFIRFWKHRVDDYSVSSFCNPFIGKQRYQEIENKYRLKDFDLNFCYEPYQRLFIRNSGEVVPCCSFFGGEMILGNIYENSIYKIWNNKKTKEIRLLVNKGREQQPLACQKCRNSLKSNKLI